LLDKVKPLLSSISRRKAVFDRNYVKMLMPERQEGQNKLDLAEQVRADIREFRKSPAPRGW